MAFPQNRLSAIFCLTLSNSKLPQRKSLMSANAQTFNAAHAGDIDRHPKGLAVLFATEMWERFSFYSMLALFTLYLRDPSEGFGWTAAEATWLYSTYLMFV